MENIKVKLKKNVTEEQFLDATFGKYYKGSIFDIKKMKSVNFDATIDYKTLHIPIVYKDTNRENNEFYYELVDDCIWEVIEE
jgi:hypothetical protein